MLAKILDAAEGSQRNRRQAEQEDQIREHNMLLEAVARPLARTFRVSLPAMRIRLEDVGLLIRDDPTAKRSFTGKQQASQQR